jgi:hypothetical protein
MNRGGDLLAYLVNGKNGQKTSAVSDLPQNVLDGLAGEFVQLPRNTNDDSRFAEAPIN